MNNTLIAAAKQTESISCNARRHALLDIQALIHAEIAPEINLRLAAERDAFMGADNKFYPFTPLDYAAADVAIAASTTPEEYRAMNTEVVQLGTLPAVEAVAA